MLDRGGSQAWVAKLVILTQQKVPFKIFEMHFASTGSSNILAGVSDRILAGVTTKGHQPLSRSLLKDLVNFTQ